MFLFIVFVNMKDFDETKHMRCLFLNFPARDTKSHELSKKFQ